MLYLAVKLKPHGIIAIRSLPQSKMRVASRYAPPSTLLGALVYSVVRLRGERKETILRGNVFKSYVEAYKDLVVNIAMNTNIHPIIFGFLLRINRYYRKEIDSSITSFPVAIYYSSVDPVINVIYLINDSILDQYGLSKNDLLRAGWGITRVGSRESIVSVENVIVEEAIIHEIEVSEDEAIDTEFSFEYKSNISIKGHYFLEYVVNWKKELTDYSLAEKIPIVYPEGKVFVWGKVKFLETKLGNVVM